MNFEEPFASGAEKNVFHDRHHFDRVLKVAESPHSNANTVKSRFYLGNILNILMPEHFPHIHYAGRDEESTVATMSVEKRERDALHTQANDLLMKVPSRDHRGLDDKDRAEFETIEERQKETGLGKEIETKLGALGMGYDKKLRNIARESQGNEVYLDTINPWVIDTMRNRVSFNFDKDALRAAIDKLEDANLRQRAYEYLGRIEVLGEEEGVTYKNKG